MTQTFLEKANEEKSKTIFQNLQQTILDTDIEHIERLYELAQILDIEIELAFNRTNYEEWYSCPYIYKAGIALANRLGFIDATASKKFINCNYKLWQGLGSFKNPSIYITWEQLELFKPILKKLAHMTETRKKLNI